MLDRAGGGSAGATEFGSDEGAGAFGSPGPSVRERQPALAGAGAGKGGDMDDEIPF
jgi:single-strand DNA-binding protein